MTIPNLLTFARILLTPLLAWFLLREWMRAAFLVFFIAGLTDVLDGLLARALSQKSRLGSYVDPVADKLLLVTSFVLLWHAGQVPLWLLSIAAGRDIMIVTGFLVLFFCRVRLEIRPIVSSKLSTLFQLGTVFALLGKPFLQVSGWMYSALFAITAGFSILSGGQYLSMGVSMLKSRREG
jgi:cardiolipin synthase